MRSELSHARLRELLHYDPQTGVFSHAVDQPRAHRVEGSVAGYIHTRGYRMCSVKGHEYRAHRLAWFWMTGEWPRGQIDHINTMPDDNRWSNLRDVDPLTNSQNQRRAQPGNRSGFRGVISPFGTKKKYVACINVLGKRTYLGSFDTAEQAGARYIEAKRLMHDGCTS